MKHCTADHEVHRCSLTPPHAGLALWDASHALACNLETLLEPVVDPAPVQDGLRGRAIELGAGLAPLPAMVLADMGYECVVTVRHGERSPFAPAWR